MILEKPELRRRALMAGFLLPLALDVKKFGGGDSRLQILLVAVSLLCAAVYFLQEPLSRDVVPHASKVRTMTAIWWVYLALSPLPVLLWDIDLVQYLKVLLPFGLFGVTLAVMMAAERRVADPAIFLDILLWACLISTLWRAFYAIVIADLSIQTIRWQILGPGVPFLIGYGFAALYLGRRRIVAAGALYIGLVIVLLSVTRSYLISIFFVLVGIFVVGIRQGSVLQVVRRGSEVLPAFVVVAALATASAAFLRPNLFDVWFARLFHHQVEGLDITLITRVAEYGGMVNSLTRGTYPLLLGNGIGAPYQLDSEVLKMLPFAMHTSGSFAGHSTWMYPFFASGIVLGAVVPYVLLGSLVHAFKASSVSANDSSVSDASFLVLIIYLAYIGQSFTANLFHERFSGIILGVLVGASLAGAGRIHVQSQVVEKVEHARLPHKGVAGEHQQPTAKRPRRRPRLPVWVELLDKLARRVIDALRVHA